MVSFVTGIYRRGTHKSHSVKSCILEDERGNGDAAVKDTCKSLSYKSL